MTAPISIDLIKARLLERIDLLVPQLYPNARRQGAEWVLGDVHGSPGRSMSIRRTGTRAGVWSDFGGSARGDVLDLVAAGACQGDVKAAIGWARDWLGLGSMTEDQLRRAEAKARRLTEEAAAREQDDRVKTRRRAQGLYLGGETWEGSPVERYMLGRAIDLSRLPRPPRSLRFHGAAWCSEIRAKLPAMVAPFSAVDGQFVAVHRTYIEIRGDGSVAKAALKDAKKAWGSFEGAHIPIARGASDKPASAMPDGEMIAIAEGIENALSAALIRPERRVWAAGTLRNLGEVQLPPACGGVFIIADNDTKPDAVRGFERVCQRLERRGVRFQIIRPPAGIKDFNDWLQALARQPGGVA